MVHPTACAAGACGRLAAWPEKSGADRPRDDAESAARDLPALAEKACKVEACPGCLTNFRGGVSSAYSTGSATARKGPGGVRRGCSSTPHANRPQSRSASPIPATRCGKRRCTRTSASSCSRWMSSWRFWRSAEDSTPRFRSRRQTQPCGCEFTREFFSFDLLRISTTASSQHCLQRLSLDQRLTSSQIGLTSV